MNPVRYHLSSAQARMEGVRYIHYIRVTLAILICLGIGAISQATAQPNAWINEVHYDNVGTDSGEFIEVVVGGAHNPSDFSVALYNGSTGAEYNTTALDAYTEGDTENGFTFYSYVYPTNGIQNGSPDGIALVHDGTVLQFLSYEGVFVAGDGPAAGRESEDILVDEGGSTPEGSSLQLAGIGTDYDQFGWDDPKASTVGALNSGQTLADKCGGTLVKYEWQDDAFVLEEEHGMGNVIEIVNVEYKTDDSETDVDEPIEVTLRTQSDIGIGAIFVKSGTHVEAFAYPELTVTATIDNRGSGDKAISNFELCVERGTVRPIFECYVDHGDGSYLGNFGYLNTFDEAVDIPQGALNKITPAAFDGLQPTTFNSGRTPYDTPGAFQVAFEAGDLPIVWTLLGRTATAGVNDSNGDGFPKECPVENCPTSTFNVETTGAENQAILTVQNEKGITTVRFRDENGEPFLNNLTASTSTPNVDRINQGSDIDWTYTGPEGSAPTEITFVLEQIDGAQASSFFAEATSACGEITLLDPPLFEAKAARYALEGNYPNPVTQVEGTTFSFRLPEDETVRLDVYDVMGRRVATVVDRSMPAGTHEVRWNGRSETGRLLASGVYFYRLEAGPHVETRRLTVVR